jgi:hypothetical protein
VLALERSRLLAAHEAATSRPGGGSGGGETPVPIPNTAVKPTSADGTWRGTSWESRAPPTGLSRRRPGPLGPGLSCDWGAESGEREERRCLAR